ncbi:MAG: hypothetical protein IH614_17345 [Desulfuromonadales bacterium]|nr:hypothetical protein [Desulfuromonadales bacterium]
MKVLLGLIFLTLSVTIASANEFRVEGYGIWIFAHQKFKEVKLGGRVDGGRSCGTLVITAAAETASGERINLKAVAHDAGRSTIIQGESKAVSGGVRIWTVTDVKVLCRNP